MATPAAVLTVMVKAQGAAAAAAQINEVQIAAARASGSMDKASGTAKKHGAVLRGLGDVAKVAGLTLGAAGLAKGLGTAVSEYREAQKVGAQTNAVLKSTHGAAKISQKGIEDLAGAISKKSGIDDEAIQSTENLLLTFTSLRNEAGKGNDIFNRATQTVTDMSAALGQSGKSSAIQLGKALQDPIKGITALRRVGVNFNQQQSDQIKKMVESGHMLQAQKTILRELGTEFGGSAAAQATAGDKMRVAFSNLAEAAGRFLVPAMDKVATVLTKVINDFVEGKGIARIIIPVFLALGATIQAVVGPIIALVKGFQEGKTWAVALGTAIAALTAGFVAYRLIVTAITIATRIWAATQALLNVALTANPIGLVLVAIAALVAAFVVAYKKSETFRNIVDTLWSVLKTVFGWVRSNWPLLLAILTGPFGLAALLILKHADVIKGVIAGAFNWIKGHWPLLLAILAGPFALAVLQIVKHAHDIRNAVVGAFNAMVGAIKALASTFVGLGVWVLTRIIQGIKSYVGALLAVGKWYYGRLFDGLRAVAGAIQSLGAWTVHRVVDGIRATTSGLLAIGSWLKNRLLDGLRAVKDGFTGLGGTIIDWIVDGLKAGANKLVGFLNSIVGVINKLPGVDIGKIKGFAEGGVNQGNVPRGLAHGGAFARTKGVVNGPITLMGEEAPRHPEYVIPTNPAYRKRARGLLGQAAGALGFAQGGAYSKDDLVDLWKRVNDGLGNANLMAAIALAESRGNPAARNPSGASGLWQILGVPFPGNPFDPVTNARMAGAKLRSQGLGAWEAYTNGSYKQFLGGGGGILGAIGGAVGAIGGVVGDLISKGAGFLIGQLPGTGGLPDWLKGMGSYVLDHVGGFIKDKVTGILDSIAGGDSGDGKFPSGPNAKRLTQAVGLARRMGLSITSTTGGGHVANSWHYQGRAFDTSGSPGAMMAFAKAAIDTFTPSGLLELFYDPLGRYVKNGSLVAGAIGGHSDHVHVAMAKGGLYPYAGSFAQGGTVPGPKGAPSVAVVHGGEQIIRAAQGIKFGTNFLSQYEAAPFNAATANLALAQAQGDTVAQIANLTTLAQVTYDRIEIAQRILAQGSAVDRNAMTQALADLVTSLHETEASLGALTAVATPAPADTAATDGLADNVSELNDTISRLNDLVEQQRQEALTARQAYNVSQSQYAVLAKAIADISNGQIGGRVGLGFMTPGFAGGGVRY